MGLLLDAGCGTGRNLAGFLESGHRVVAVDMDLDALTTAKSLLIEEDGSDAIYFAVVDLESLSFPDGLFDEVHFDDVLHWAKDQKHFEAMWYECWRILKPGGIFSASFRCVVETKRLDEPWFLADRALIEDMVVSLRAKWLMPLEIKTAADFSVAVLQISKL
mgnify:CR=1 FL=1|jgi:tellurite methyltransferase